MDWHLMSAAIRELVRPGETMWSLERNAAAAGFFNVEEYLKMARK